MQLLSSIEIEAVSGGMVVDINNLPPGIVVDENGNPYTENGLIPLF